MTLAEVPHPNDDKYIVFNREDFLRQVSGLPDAIWKRIEVPDAVVIRRQDYFASPALASYAASIAMTIKLLDDAEKRAQLLAIADYFQRQAELAADEGFKWPDL